MVSSLFPGEGEEDTQLCVFFCAVLKVLLCLKIKVPQEVPAAVIACTRLTHVQAGQHSSMDGEGLTNLRSGVV